MAGLDPQILESFLKEDLLSAYRFAAVKCLIGQHYDILPACWRMLNSAAAQLRHLNGLNETIQALLTNETMKGIKSNRSTNGPADILNSMQPKVLEEALLTYQALLRVTLNSQSCPAPQSLSDIVLTRIQAVNIGDISLGSLEPLKEVAVMCQAVSDIIVWEVHALCPEVGSLLRALGKRACAVQASTTSPAPERSGDGNQAVTPNSRASGETPTETVTSREALEGW